LFERQTDRGVVTARKVTGEWNGSGNHEADDEDDYKIVFVVTDHDLKMAKLIRESCWNVGYQYNENRAKKRPTAMAKNF
jgi:hypothetical protein